MNVGGKFPGGTPVHEFIPCQLFGQEPVVRFVLIEGTNHIIAVAPFAVAINYISDDVVEPKCVYVAGPIQPMARPFLAEVRRSKKTVNKMLPGLRRLISDEGVDFFRRVTRAKGLVMLGRYDRIVALQPCATNGE